MTIAALLDAAISAAFVDRGDGDSDCRGCGFRAPGDFRKTHRHDCPVIQLIELAERLKADPSELNHADDDEFTYGPSRPRRIPGVGRAEGSVNTRAISAQDQVLTDQ